MTAQQLSAVDPLLTVSGTLAFFGAAVLVLSGRGSIGSAIGSLACGLLGALATLGRVPVVVALTGHGWWFGADKMLLGLPLAVVTGAFAAVLAGPCLVRAAGGRADEGGRRRAAAGLFIAG